MTTRSTNRTIHFTRTFRLTGVDADLAAGAYVITTEEEQIASLTFLAWKRVSTAIQLDHDGSTEYLTVDPVELNEVLTKDRAVVQTSEPTPRARENATRGKLAVARIAFGRAKRSKPT